MQSKSSSKIFGELTKRGCCLYPRFQLTRCFFQQSQSLLKLSEKEVNKFWHLKRCQYIGSKSEGYRLGLTNCQVCKMNLVQIVGGKCTRPEHSNITKVKEKNTNKTQNTKNGRKSELSKSNAKNVTAQLFSTRKPGSLQILQTTVQKMFSKWTSISWSNTFASGQRLNMWRM